MKHTPKIYFLLHYFLRYYVPIKFITYMLIICLRWWNGNPVFYHNQYNLNTEDAFLSHDNEN